MTDIHATGRVNTRRAARHITNLRRQGMTTRYIARTAGVAEKTVWAIGAHQLKYTYARTANRILTVRHDHDGGRNVPAVGAVRRMQAMISEGRPQTYLSQQLGWTTTQIWRLLNGRRTHITRDSAALVDALYRATDGQPVPTGKGATRSRRYAAAHGWHGRDAWYDDTIDDPDAPPYFTGHLVDDLVDDLLVQRAIDGDSAALGRLNKAEKVEATRRLLARPGVGVGSLPRLLNVSGKTAHRLAEQAGVAA